MRDFSISINKIPEKYSSISDIKILKFVVYNEIQNAFEAALNSRIIDKIDNVEIASIYVTMKDNEEIDKLIQINKTCDEIEAGIRSNRKHKSWVIQTMIEDQLEKLHQDMFDYDFKFVFVNDKEEEEESGVHEEE